MEPVIVSIIVPVFNCEQFVGECIDSILNQSFKYFELILINDGSFDGTLDICNRYAKIDARVRVFSHSNMGVSKTRKKGLGLAKGDYIAFVDSDDMIKSDYLEKLYNAINDENVDVVCCNSIDSISVDENIYIKEDEYITQNYRLLKAYFEKKRYAYCIWGKLFKKRDLEKIIFPNMKYSEDAYVVQTIFLNASSVKLLKYYGYHYTDNPNGAMSNSRGLQLPIDSLKCTTYVSNICIHEYPELIDVAKTELVRESFSVLINSSIESAEVRNSVDELLSSSCDIIGYHFLSRSKKGKVLIAYQKFPKVINLLLKVYYIIKHNILRK